MTSARFLVVLDADSTLIRNEVIELLADEAGRGPEVQAATEAAMGRSNWEGVTPPQLFAGTIGPDAGALGGALLPLHANFAPDRDLFIKEHA